VDQTSSNVAREYGDHRSIASFVSEIGYLAAFSNAGGSKLSDVLNYANFAPF